jgi:hypothetical protein
MSDSVSVDPLQRFRLILDTPEMRELSVAEQRYQAVIGDGLSISQAAFWPRVQDHPSFIHRLWPPFDPVAISVNARRRGSIHSVPASSASARSLAASSEGKGDASVVSLASTSTASHQPSSSAPIRYSRLSLQACSTGLNEAATEPVSFVTTSDQ